MIHLDTNYLIGLLVKGSVESGDVDAWLAVGQTLAASAIAWTEFLNGPIAPLEVSRPKRSCSRGLSPSAKRKRRWQPICSTRPDGGAALDLSG